MNLKKIERLAYQLWEAQGRREGSDLIDWQLAEYLYATHPVTQIECHGKFIGADGKTYLDLYFLSYNEDIMKQLQPDNRS